MREVISRLQKRAFFNKLLGVATVLITQAMDDVPFDYQHRRCIVYHTEDVEWDKKLRDALTKTIQAELASHYDEDLRWPYDTFLLGETHQVGALLTAKDATHTVIRGAMLVGAAVAQGLGPHGTHISKIGGLGGHLICRSGSEIAGAIRSSNPLEARGVDEMQQVAKDMFASVGDGTKTAVLLASEMGQQAQAALEAGRSQKDVLRGMARAVEKAIEHITSEARDVEPPDVRRVAATAARGDQEVAELLAEATKRVGKDGVITMERALGHDTALEVSEGLQFDRGYLSEHFVTDFERGECTLDDCYVLITQERIGSMLQLLPVLECVAKAGKPAIHDHLKTGQRSQPPGH